MFLLKKPDQTRKSHSCSWTRKNNPTKEFVALKRSIFLSVYAVSYTSPEENMICKNRYRKVMLRKNEKLSAIYSLIQNRLLSRSFFMGCSLVVLSAVALCHMQVHPYCSTGTSSWFWQISPEIDMFIMSWHENHWTERAVLSFLLRPHIAEWSPNNGGTGSPGTQMLVLLTVEKK